MKTITRNEAEFTELFEFAENKFNIDWNECCDMFHRSEILRYERDTTFYLNDIVNDILVDSWWYKNHPEMVKAYEIIRDFLIDLGVDELVITHNN